MNTSDEKMPTHTPDMYHVIRVAQLNTGGMEMQATPYQAELTPCCLIYPYYDSSANIVMDQGEAGIILSVKS